MTSVDRQWSGVRPQLKISGERGSSWQGIFGMDPVGNNSGDSDISEEESEDSIEESTDSIDDVQDVALDPGDQHDNIDEEDIDVDEKESTNNNDIELEVHEEAPIRMQRNPADPTPEERARHDATHLPYRPWCPVCVEARAIEDPHYKLTKDEKKQGLPQICADYCEIGEDANDKTDKQYCLVARDRWSKAIYATVVEAKGNSDVHCAKGLKAFIESIGYSRLELKTDGEPALVDVARKTKEISEAKEIILKNSPAYDPKANGVAERAVREFKEQLRATKIALERRIKTKIDSRAPILLWMVCHAVETINRFLIGSDGRTAHYRLHNKNFNGKVAEFGEMVFAKPLRKASRKRALKSRVVSGIWLGIHPKTGEHRVALLGGGPVIRVRTIIRRPDSEKWNAEEVGKLTATPRQPNPLNKEQTEPNSIRETKGIDIGGDGSKLLETPVQEAGGQTSRDFRITYEILQKFGYTKGCAGCEARALGMAHRTHTAACRMRLEEKMIDDEKLKHTLKKRDERVGMDKTLSSSALSRYRSGDAGGDHTNIAQDDKDDKSAEDDFIGEESAEDDVIGDETFMDAFDGAPSYDKLTEPASKKQRVQFLRYLRNDVNTNGTLQMIMNDLDTHPQIVETNKRLGSLMEVDKEKIGRKPAPAILANFDAEAGNTFGVNVTNEINQVMKFINILEANPPIYDDYDFVDDISFKKLDKSKAIEARKLEVEFFRKMNVYRKVPRSKAKGQKIIATKWLDVNKGDEERPNYRARLVGCELKLKDKRLDLFAATPPLESLRLLCSMCASNQWRERPYRILSVDVKRAYFYAAARRDIYIEIPIEDWAPGDEYNVAKLNLSLYGTRDAAQNWSEEYTRRLRELGFTVGNATPCNFVCEAKELHITVHGDDFTIVGPMDSLEWLNSTLEQIWDIKSEFLGPQKEGCKTEIRVLNRILRWTDQGVEYESDQIHSDLIIDQMEVSNCLPVSTPCCTDSEYDEAKRGESGWLESAEATAYRALAARLNYLALDRPDVQYPAKEIAKHMANPTNMDWLKLKRVARYLAGAPRYVQRYKWQWPTNKIDGYSDSDWAGDRITRKSTSGGMLLIGNHLVKSWSSSQPVVALSSGEAELYALIKTATQAKGLCSLLGDFGQMFDTTVHTDSTAAMGIVHRKGLGKTRHIEVQYLWIQDKVHEKELAVRKVGTSENPADMLTKALKRETINKHVKFVHGYICTSRASSALSINCVNRSDHWQTKSGKTIVRIHAKPRDCLFTPMKVAGGPMQSQMLEGLRLTIGQFKDGENFVVEDDWKNSSDPHRRLKQPWTGCTVFVAKQ